MKFYSKKQYYYILCKLLLLINIIIINLRFFDLLFDRSKIIIKKNINYIYSYNISVNEAALKANKFIKNSCKGLLKYKIPLKIYQNPLVSAIIPIYNRENTIKRAVRSIQNQNNKLIEIILVNDFSLDHTNYIIKELNKEDLRIKVINNKKNMGTLYSRCIGTLISKGKYIFPLDSDDMFLSEDVFNVVYKVADENNFDIVNFKGIMIWDFKNSTINNHIKEYRSHKTIIVENQPELGYNAVGKLLLSGKCIKGKIYKKAIKAYGQKKYTTYVTNLEDAIINFIICQLSENSISILKYGVLIIRTKNSVSTSKNQPQKYKFIMKYIETLFDFSSNSIRGKIGAFFHFNKLLNNKDLMITFDDKNYKDLLKSLIYKFLSSKYISKINKDKIKKNKIFSTIY